MKNVFVTGTSSGIGLAIVKRLIQDQQFIIHALIRRDEDAKKLNEIDQNIHCYISDITDYDNIRAVKKELTKNLSGEKLYALVNNAGIAVPGPLELLDINEVKRQFEVNVFANLFLTQELFSLLDINNSKIINMSSKSGQIALPFTGAYAASKHAMEAISDSMRRELLNTNIKIVVVQPGAVNTPIWSKADGLDITPYKNSRYASVLPKIKGNVIKGGMGGANADKLAKLIYKILLKKNPKTRYLFSKNTFKEIIIPILLPDKLLDRIIKRKLY